MTNVQSTLRAHNKAVLAAKPRKEEGKYNCRKKEKPFQPKPVYQYVNSPYIIHTN